MIRDRFNRLEKPPRETWGLLVGVIVANMSAYWIAPLVNLRRVHYDLSIVVDARIPLVTPFIVIYFMGILQWVVSFWLASLEEKRIYWPLMVGSIIAKLTALAIYLALPTTMARPNIEVKNAFDWIVSMVYRIDRPENLFPSIHCIESWIALRGGFWFKRTPRWYRWAMATLSVLVFASTMLVKQHVFVDVISGLLVAEVGLTVAKALYRRRSPIS